MIVLHGCLRIATGKREETLTALEALVEGSRAESGCLAFTVAVDILDDHLLRVVEAFEDEVAWHAHGKAQHVTEWQTAASLLAVTDIEVRSYDAARHDGGAEPSALELQQ